MLNQNRFFIKVIFVFLFIPLFTTAQHSRTLVDNDFSGFIQNLENSCKSRDVNNLVKFLHDTILESNDICGYPGCSKEEFLKHYFTGTESKDWKLLNIMLQIGFKEIHPDSSIVKFEGIKKIFEAPFYMRQINWSESLIILENNTQVRELPSSKGPLIKISDKGEIFECNCCIYYQQEGDLIKDSDGQYWIKIILKNKSSGYVEINKTSQKFYKILEVALINNEWKIIAWYTQEPC